MARADKYVVKDGPKVSPQRAGVPPASRRKLPVRQLLHLVWRLVIFGAAIFYIEASLRSGIAAIEMLGGVIDDSMSFVPYEAELVRHFFGPTKIRHSRVIEFLGDSTTPRNDTMYLESSDRVSFDGCSHESKFNSWLYGNAFVRRLWTDLVNDVGGMFKPLRDNELVVPIVDCSFGSITSGDDTVARVFFLVRKSTDTNDVAVASFSFSMQDYVLEEEHQHGSAGIGVLAFVDDLSVMDVEYFYAIRLGYPYQQAPFEAYDLLETSDSGFWILESVTDSSGEVASKVIKTASRTGFFINADTEQANIKNLHWDQPQDPILSMTMWNWIGRTELRDSWAWVHGIHFIFAIDAIMNVGMLMLIVYQNFRKRKFWMGDAFMSVTSTIELRGLVVLATWYVNGFWTLMEFCLFDANAMGTSQRIYTNAYVIRADLMTVYMCLAGFFGKVLRERVDPALVVFIFQIGFHHRHDIASWFPETERVAVEFATSDYMKGMAEVMENYKSVSPLRLWTTHPMSSRDVRFVCASLFPTFASFIFIIVFVIVRKMYRRAYPSAKVVWSRMTGQSTETESLLSWKSTLTMFEVATGAPLQNRVGLTSDYDNCIYIKGMKFASPDGIYCNGFVIINGKHLVATSDVLSILIIVASRIRFRNVYAYEVQGHQVQQRARLVYPETMTLKDLTRLNINILA